jgi:predicted NACHT family NTPase
MPVLEVLRNKNNQRLVILGDPGAGKSSLAHVQLLEWVASENNGNPIPFLIELRRYHREAPNADFITYLSRNQGLRYNPSAGALRKHLTAGTVTLIFDGLDEIFDPQHRLEVGGRIIKLTQKYPIARIVVTSRLVGYPPRLLRDAGFDHWLLQDFDEPKIQQFLSNWCTLVVREDRDRHLVRSRVQTAVSVNSIQELAGNPLLLTMMAMLARQSDLPRDQITLYQECSKLLLELWEANKVLERDKRLAGIRIDWRDKHELLCRVAWTMQNAGAGLRGNLIQRPNLEAIMHDSLSFIIDSSQRRLVIELVLNQLRERNFILAHLGNEYYAFVHRGFLEFFCAEEIRRISSSGDKPPSIVASRIFKRHAKQDAWKEVLILASANLPPAVADAALVAAVEARNEKSDTPIEIAMGVLRRARNIRALPRIENLMRHVAESEIDNLERLRDLLNIWPDDRTIGIFEQVVRRGRKSEWSWIAVNFLCQLRPDEMTFQIAKTAATSMNLPSINIGSILEDLTDYFPTHKELPDVFRQLARRKDAAEIFADAQIFAPRGRRLARFIQEAKSAVRKRGGRKLKE